MYLERRIMCKTSVLNMDRSCSLAPVLHASKIEDKIQTFDVFLRLCHFYGTVCAVVNRELLRNF